MAQEIDIKKYTEFVDTLTSRQSKDFNSYITELKKLNDLECNIARLDCAITGMCSESGEANEILKKLKFQGKEWNEEVKFHLKREAGDIIFYWINFCLALGMDPGDVIAENVIKLEARYPGGKFSVWHSENKKEGDL